MSRTAGLLAVWRAQVDMIDIRLDPEEVVYELNLEGARLGG